ncbi:hypothetical protein EV186_101369 [Labedaea rhizosphaerae]|uniref:Uncharacterized protein n=1 Tax=Labedaea rhizosphaerae TaxID=598644 RepID=A0A4R6SKH2_LABRH|nr:hypothetical protein EV186_101369 [Labedaea rhizosphaerae]
MIRARRYPIAAVRGCLYTGRRFPKPTRDVTVCLNDRAVRWVKAVNLVRELQDCTLIEVSDVPAGPMEGA